MTRPSRLAAAHLSMAAAVEAINLAVLHLQLARKDYAHKSHPMPLPLRRARLEALDAKIAALQGVRSDPNAHPWIGDLS